MSTPPVVLSVAGTDSGGAAGTAADLATFAALGVHGACVITAVTAQDTTGVHEVHQVPLDIVDAQITAVLQDLPVAATKTGMLGTPEVVELVARRLVDRPLVVDPVLVATSGAELGSAQVARAYVEVLLPVATVITPNPSEAAVLCGVEASPAVQAETLARHGCAVVVTGGPEGKDTRHCTDWLAVPGQQVRGIAHPLVPTSNDHGTGCTHSSALAASLAQGRSVPEAAADAAAYVARQLARSSTWDLGRGRGPVAHLH